MAHLISGGSDDDLRLRPLTSPRFGYCCPSCGDTAPDNRCCACWTHGMCSVTDRFYDGAVLNGVPHGRGRMLFLFYGSSYSGNFHANAFKGKGRYTWFEGSVLYAEWAKGEPVRDSRFAGVDGTRMYDMVYKAGALQSASRLVLPHGGGEVRARPAKARKGGKAGTSVPSALGGNDSKETPGAAVSTTTKGAGAGNARLARAAAVQAEAGGVEYAYYANPLFGIAHFHSPCARAMQVPALALPALLFLAAFALDFASLPLAYLGGTCRMTNPQVRSCFGQEPGTCCKGETTDTLGFAIVGLLLLTVALGAVILSAVRRLDLTIGAPLPSFLHVLGLTPLWHAVRLASAITKPRALGKPGATTKAPAITAGPGKARAPVMSLGMGKAGRTTRNTSFGEANPMGDLPNGAGGTTAPKPTGGSAGGTPKSAGMALAGDLPGPLLAVSEDPRSLQHTGAPWLFTGVSRAQVTRVVQHCVLALVLHSYGVFGLWSLEDVPTVEVGALVCGAVALWWTLVASDVGGLTLKSQRFLNPAPDAPLWKDKKMPSLFIREAPADRECLWLVMAFLVSGLYRAAELIARLVLLGGLLGVTRGVMLALLVPLWMATYYAYAAWSYPRERDYEFRGGFAAWAEPHWPDVSQRQAKEVAAATGGPTPSATGAAKTQVKAPKLGDAKAPTPTSPKVTPPTLPGSKGGLKGGGKEEGTAPVSARSTGPSPATPPIPSARGSGRGDSKPPASHRGGASTVRKTGTPPPATPPCPLRCRHCCEGCTTRTWDCLRPGIRDCSIWWWERGLSPLDPRFLLSLLAFPAPNWSPLFPTVGTVGAPLTALFPVWSFFSTRALEDILGVLLFAALQRYGENPFGEALNSSGIGPLVRVWCCLDATWLLLVATTLIKYILLPFYLNLFQLLAQPPLEEDGEDVAEQSAFSFAWWRRVDPSKVPDWATDAQPGQTGHRSAHRPSAIAGQVLTLEEQAQLQSEVRGPLSPVDPRKEGRKTRMSMNSRTKAIAGESKTD